MSGRIRRTPKPSRIMLGAVIIGLGAWLFVSYLPSRQPLNTDEREALSQQAGADESRWRFSEPLYRGAQGAAGGFLFIGFIVAARGALFRPRARVQCKQCRAEVVASKDGFHFKCQNGNHRAATSRASVLLLALFLLNAVGLGVLLVIGAFMGVT